MMINLPHRFQTARRWLNRLALPVAALLAVAPASAAQVYRCVDGAGAVTLSDQPCPPGSSGMAEQVRSPPSGWSPAAVVEQQRPLVEQFNATLEAQRAAREAAAARAGAAPPAVAEPPAPEPTAPEVILIRPWWPPPHYWPPPPPLARPAAPDFPPSPRAPMNLR